MDNDPEILQASELISRDFRRLGLEPPRIVQGDLRALPESVLEPRDFEGGQEAKGGVFDAIVADPPYDMRAAIQVRCAMQLRGSPVLRYAVRLRGVRY
eukprot:2595169-Rhodomonas_salina.1